MELKQNLGNCRGGGGGGEEYSNYFWTDCAAQGLKPLPISYDFSQSKSGWIDTFFEIFANRYPFLRVFLPQKWLILHSFCIFCEMGPSSKDFLWPNWDPCLRIFGQKVTHLGGTSLYALKGRLHHAKFCNLYKWMLYSFYIILW